MVDASKPPEPELQTEPVITKPASVVQDVQSCFALLAQSVDLFEARLTTRVLRLLPSIRKRLDANSLTEILQSIYPSSSSQKDMLLSLLGNEDGAMDVDGATDSAKPPKPAESISPEADIYSTLLVILYSIDKKHYPAGLALADHTIQRIQSLNKRTLDQLAAKVYFYYARLAELSNDSAITSGLRSTFLAAHKTAALRNDQESVATLLNLLIRNYYAQNQFDQADKLIAKVKYPDPTSVSNAQLARWLYYVGRLRAIQLRYTESHNLLQQAIRRAPAAATAPGFFQAAHKLSVIVEMLMGDIPDRKLFRHPVLRKPLSSYLTVVQAVRVGNLSGFTEALATHAKQFKADVTYTLIARLRVNVIKTALRTISLAYSRIPLSVVCTKLGLDSEEEAEYVVAKAIKDGVVEAGLDHEKGWMMSAEKTDVYASSEPMRAFDERIKFCLQLRNESVKAMRYPMQANKKDLANAVEAREREKELAQDILEGKADEDDAEF